MFQCCASDTKYITSSHKAEPTQTRLKRCGTRFRAKDFRARPRTFVRSRMRLPTRPSRTTNRNASASLCIRAAAGLCGLNFFSPSRAAVVLSFGLRSWNCACHLQFYELILLLNHPHSPSHNLTSAQAADTNLILLIHDLRKHLLY